MKYFASFIVLLILGICFLFSRMIVPPIAHGPNYFWDYGGTEFIFYKEAMLSVTPNNSFVPNVNHKGFGKGGWALSALLELKEQEFSLDEQKEIPIFLHKYSLSFFEDESFLSAANSFVSNRPYYGQGKYIYLNIPQIAIEVMFEYDSIQALRSINEIWEYHLNKPNPNPYALSIRDKLLFNLYGHYQNDRALALLNKFKEEAKFPFDKRQRKIISNANLYNKVSKLENESIAWEYLWEISKENEMSTFDVIHNTNWHYWAGNIYTMNDIFEVTSLEPTLDIIEKSEGIEKKFIFLGCTCRLWQILNEKWRRPNNDFKGLNMGEYDKLNSLFINFLSENPAFLNEAKGENKDAGVLSSCKDIDVQPYLFQAED